MNCLCNKMICFWHWRISHNAFVAADPSSAHHSASDSSSFPRHLIGQCVLYSYIPLTLNNKVSFLANFPMAHIWVVCCGRKFRFASNRTLHCQFTSEWYGGAVIRLRHMVQRWISEAKVWFKQQLIWLSLMDGFAGLEMFHWYYRLCRDIIELLGAHSLDNQVCFHSHFFHPFIEQGPWEQPLLRLCCCFGKSRLAR